MAEKLSEKTGRYFMSLGVVNSAIRASQRIVLPTFDGLSIYEVSVFFIKGIQKGSISSRSSSIAFNFFLAIFPAILFFFTLIPYLPIENFEQSLMDLLQELLPRNAFLTIESTIKDILTHRQGGLLSIGFLMALYFATNGIRSIIEAFNMTIHTVEKRTWIRYRLDSLLLVVLLSFLMIIAIFLITAGTSILDFLMMKKLMVRWIYYYLILAGNWIVITALVYFGVSFIYYFAPGKQMRFRFYSAGSNLATTLILLTSLGFNYYVSHFSRYNALYGSIGTLIIVLLWIYFNASILLLGFELNASIHQARRHKKGFK